MSNTVFVPLDDEREPTRATLHAYAKGVGAVAGAHAVFHPKWWHISLKVRPNGLVTDNLPLPGGGSLALRMDLVNDLVAIEASDGSSIDVPMTDGLTGSEFADNLIAAVAGYGLEGEYLRDKFEDDTPREYDSQAATKIMDLFVNANTVFERQRATLGDSVGPIQLWPHGFDLAFEWYGSRIEEHEEDGEVRAYPAQLNFGLYPAGRAYFYSNPWPFAGTSCSALNSRTAPSGTRTAGREVSSTTTRSLKTPTLKPRYSSMPPQSWRRLAPPWRPERRRGRRAGHRRVPRHRSNSTVVDCGVQLT